MASSRLKRRDDLQPPATAAADPGLRVPKANAQDIARLAQQATDILSRAREAALAPGVKKTLRKFNLKEVAELLAISPKTLVRAAQRGDIPGGERVRGNRLLFGLEEIHDIQSRLGLSPSRDPATDKPIVITGSANYSENSTTLNDENTLCIKGDKRVADIYFTEFVRLFDHFSFREWLNTHTAAFHPFLDETGKWINKYFDNPEYLSVKRKLIFKNMAV